MSEKDLKKRLANLFSDVKESLIETRQATALRPAENEALLQSLIDELPVGYHEIDAEGRITRVNRTELAMLGYAAEEMLGRPAWEFILDSEAARRAIQDKLTGQIPLKTVEGTCLHKDGRHVPVLIQDRHLLNLNGKIVGIRTTVEDITEHKQAEERFREKVQYRSLVEHIPAIVYLDATDETSSAIYTSPQIETMLGYSSDEWVADPQLWVKLLHPDDRERVLAENERTNKTGERFSIEYRMVARDGRVVWVHDEAVLARDAAGQPLYWQGVLFDITERKRTEEALKASEEKYRTILENIQEGYFETDIAGNLTFFNDAVVRILGYPRSKLMGMNNREYMDEENARAVYRAFNTVYRTRQPSQAIRYEILGRDGLRRSIEVSASLITNPMDEPIGFRGIMRDITEHKQVEKTLERRAMQLQTAAQVSRAASSLLDPEELMSQTAELIRERFKLYYVGLFLVDETGQSAVLRAGTGEAGHKLLQAGHKLEVGGSSMIGWCVAHGQARIALDVGEEAVRFSNPLLPDTRSEMALPLISRGRVIGAMSIQSEQPAAFSQEDVAILQTMADQLATAIENARLFQSTQAFAERQAIANEVLRMAMTAETATRMFEAATQTTSRRLQMPCMVLLLDQTGQTLQVQSICGPDGNLATLEAAQSITPDNNPIMFQAIQKQKTQTVWNVPSLSRGTAISIAQRFNVENAAYVPIVGHEQALGLFVLGQPFGHPRLDADEIAFIEILASQLALGLENRRSLEQAQARAEEMATLNELSRAFSTRLDLSQVLDEVYRGASRLMDTTNFYIALYDAPQNEVVFALDARGQDIRRMAGRRQAGQGMTEHVIRSRAPLLLEENVLARLQELGVESIGPEAQSWLGVPMLLGDQVLGVIAVQSYTTPRAYNSHHCDLLYAIASQAAIAIQNARLFEETHRRAEEMTALNDLSRALSARLELSQVLDEVYRGTSRLMDTTNFYVALYDAQLDEVSFPLYAEGERVRPLAGRRRSGRGMTEYIIRSRTPLLIPENIPARLQELGVESIGQEAQSWLGVPMMIGDQVLGVLAVQSYTTPRTYNEHHRDLLSAIASQTAIAIQNARLFEEARTRAEEMAALNDLSRVLSARLDLSQVLDGVYRGISRLLNTTNFYIALYDPDRHEVSFPINVSESELDQQITVMPADQGLTGYILRTRESLLIEENVAEWLEKRGMGRVGEPAQSWLGVPIMLGDQVLGVMAVQDYKRPNLYTEHDRDMLAAIASQTAIAIQNARLFGETQAALAEAQALYETSRRIEAAQDSQEMVTALAEGLRVPGVTWAALLMYERDEAGEVQAVQAQGNWYDGQDIAPMPIGTRLSKDMFAAMGVVLSSTPMFMDDTQNDLRIAATVADTLRQRNIRALGILPLTARGTQLGVLMLAGKAPYHFTGRQVQACSTLVGQMAVIMENRRLLRETEARARREQLLREITSRVRGSTDPDMIVRTAVRELGTALGRTAFIRLGSAEQLAQAPATQSAKGHGAEPPIHHTSDGDA